MLKLIFITLFLMPGTSFANTSSQAAEFSAYIDIFMSCRKAMQEDFKSKTGVTSAMIESKMTSCLDHSTRSHVSSSVLKECVRRLNSLEALRKLNYGPKIDLDYYTTYIQNCSANPFGEIPVSETIAL